MPSWWWSGTKSRCGIYDCLSASTSPFTVTLATAKRGIDASISWFSYVWTMQYLPGRIQGALLSSLWSVDTIIPTRRVLTCTGHVYCSDCIWDHVGTSTEDVYTASCPTCRSSFPIGSSMSFFDLSKLIYESTSLARCERLCLCLQCQALTLSSSCDAFPRNFILSLLPVSVASSSKHPRTQKLCPQD